MTAAPLNFFVIGGLRQDYCITHDGRAFLGVLGGNAAYAAVGARCWVDKVGIISRVGSDYPREWLHDLQQAGIDVDGVKILEEPLDTRTFYAYTSEEERVDTNPAAHFIRIGKTLPKALLDYRTSTEGQTRRDGFNPLAVRPDDLPASIPSVKGVHLAPTDYLTHATLPLRLRESNIGCITLDPSERYMNSNFERELPVVVSGLDAFLPSEMEARSFFRSSDIGIWDMAEFFGAQGCRFVIIKQGPRGQSLWDQRNGRRWHIPAYPARVRDVTGAGDAYCGGFLVGLALTGDPVEAALRGSVSASLVIEGSGALFALDAMPGLVNARLEALRPALRMI